LNKEKTLGRAYCYSYIYDKNKFPPIDSYMVKKIKKTINKNGNDNNLNLKIFSLTAFSFFYKKKPSFEKKKIEISNILHEIIHK
jgi:hypothetical protein